jgi:hypothetical protein
LDVIKLYLPYVSTGHRIAFGILDLDHRFLHLRLLRPVTDIHRGLHIGIWSCVIPFILGSLLLLFLQLLGNLNLLNTAMRPSINDAIRRIHHSILIINFVYKTANVDRVLKCARVLFPGEGRLVILVVLHHLGAAIPGIAIGLRSQLDVPGDWSLAIFAKLGPLEIDLAHVCVGFMIIVALSGVP